MAKPVLLKCPSRQHTVRLDSSRLWRKVFCPTCKIQVDPTRLRRVLKRLLASFSKRPKVTLERDESVLARFSKRPKVILVNDESRSAKLKQQIDNLAREAWHSRESLSAGFLLSPSSLSASPIERTIETMLNHVRQIASGLSVPYRVPRIETGALIDAAGQFKVSDGWVSVKIASHLLIDPKAVRAMLAHEMCHYILESSGIRDTDYEQNERLTDLCMFVCGLGEIFLDGYKRESAKNEYRKGHRLGYLTDSEYEFAARYVQELRSNNYLQLPTKTEELERKFAVRVNDLQTRIRLIKHARAMYPARSDLQLYELVIEQLERDRR
jgi:hypothetical protein